MLRSYADGSLLGSASGTAVPDVLALHGWARSHRDFDGVVAAVPDTDPAPDPGLDAIALDLPGFGQALHRPPSGVRPDATAIAAVMDEMAPTVVVIGHSFGGRVALHLAARRPDRVRALVLTGVPLFPPDRRQAPAAQFRAVRLLHRTGLIGEGRMEAARQRYGSEDYRRAEGVMRQVLVKTLGERYDEQLASIGCPVSLVWGADDTAAPVAMAEAASARLAHATLAVCPGVGHLTPLTVPRVLHHGAIGPRMIDPVTAGVLADPTGWPAWVVLGLAVPALAPAGLRWLRVAQREHYLPGAPTRFAVRWWLSEPVNTGLLALGIGGVVAGVWFPLGALLAVIATAAAPVHLAIRGRTSPLVATRRLRWLALFWLFLEALAVVGGVLGGVPAPVTAGSGLLTPVLIDLACRILAPVEDRLGQRFVEAAADRLRSVGPTIVGVTGSFGKTSTKVHIGNWRGEPNGGGQPGLVQQPGRPCPGRQRAAR